jgi:hypothetical protein
MMLQRGELSKGANNELRSSLFVWTTTTERTGALRGGAPFPGYGARDINNQRQLGALIAVGHLVTLDAWHPSSSSAAAGG